MGNELGDILRAYRRAGSPADAALATLIRVEGSSYRRTGARLLILPDGTTVGAISGGCIERDLLRRGCSVGSEPRVFCYDTSRDNGEGPGGALGCGGAIEVLVESLATREGQTGLRLLEHILESRRPAVLATVAAADGAGVRVGARTAVYTDETDFLMPMETPELDRLISADARSALEARESRSLCIRQGNAEMEVFLEVILPPLELIVFGAGADATPLAQIASVLGWRMTVVDLRSAPPRPQALPAVRVIRCGPDALGQLAIPRDTVALVMTHNYEHDLRVLQLLVDMPLRYLGVLGPRHRTERLLKEACPEGAAPACMHFPAGLDIGAEGAQEVAIAIAAEIVAVINRRRGGKLRERRGPIHDPDAGPRFADERVAECPTAV